MRTFSTRIFQISFLLLFYFNAYASTPPAESVPGEMVVKLKSQSFGKSGASFERVAIDLQSKMKLKEKISFEKFRTNEQFAVMKVSSKQKTAALGLLNKDPRVAYAEPNYIYHSFDSPNDPFFANLWNLNNQGQVSTTGTAGKSGSDIHVLQVWNEGIYGSAEVKVAVVDTGIDYTHPDLKDNIWTNPGEVGGNGKDDDGNGFIDDIHGWNFVNNSNDPMDDQNHGSHCSGVIGASGNNGVGVAGVNWKVSLIPVKFLDAGGFGSLAKAAQGIQYATKVGAQIISASWGGGNFSQALFDAISEARDHGILFVAAAGNIANNNDTNFSYPATYALDNIIAVAATDNQDHLAEFSNFGKTSVHVAAPGVEVFSTGKDGTYLTLSGTSMAAPHVSGAAALLWSTNPSLTYSQVKNILIETSDPVPELKDQVVANGRVNVYNAIHGIIPHAFSLDTPKKYDQITSK